MTGFLAPQWNVINSLPQSIIIIKWMRMLFFFFLFLFSFFFGEKRRRSFPVCQNEKWNEITAGNIYIYLIIINSSKISCVGSRSFHSTYFHSDCVRKLSWWQWSLFLVSSYDDANTIIITYDIERTTRKIINE